MHRRIEVLEEENRLAKDREEPEKENIWQTLRNFCITVIGLKREVVDGWMIKNVHRVGDYKMPKGPIIVAFVLWEDRQTMLLNGCSLPGEASCRVRIFDTHCHLDRLFRKLHHHGTLQNYLVGRG